MSTAEMVWEGAAELRQALVPVDELVPHPRNPRRGVPEEIAASLARFGQTRPIVADAESNYVIAGNHLLRAALSLGWTHVAVTRRRFESEAEAEAYLLADNRLAELGAYDDGDLRYHLEQIAAREAWEGTGYVPGDLENLRAIDALVAPPPPVEVPPGEPAEDVSEIVLLYRPEQLEEFAAAVRRLRAVYGLEGVQETVLRAVRADALALHQGEP